MGRYDRDAVFGGKVCETRSCELVGRPSGTLEFNIEAVREPDLVALERFFCERPALREEKLTEFALRGAREANQPLSAAVIKPGGVNQTAGSVVLREERFREEHAERMVALMIHRVDAEPVRLLQVLRIHDPQVASENRLDAGSERVRIKAQPPENIHQIADADCHTSALFHCMDHGIHANDAVCN